MASLSEMEMIFTLTFAFKGSVIFLKNYRVSVGEHRFELLEGRFPFFFLFFFFKQSRLACPRPMAISALLYLNFFSPLLSSESNFGW